MLRWALIFLIVALVAAVFGFGGIASGAAGIAKILFVLFLVVFVISLGYYVAPAFMRLVRAGMIEVLASDYVRTARAKGLSGTSVILKHALRNALLPQVTALGLSLGQIVSGGVLVEQVFGYPGIGRLLSLSIRYSDFNLLGGVVFIIVVGVSLATLILDLAYPRIDPRINVSG